MIDPLKHPVPGPPSGLKISSSTATVIIHQLGGRVDVRRRASEEELCLNVTQYADVLAKLMRSADGEDFSLAIYGHWGRGKTFLMEQTAKALSAGASASGGSYETINFSAWRYPARPEVWIHLYETFFRKMRESGWFFSLANVCRVGVARRGWKALIIAWSGFAFALAPKDWLLHGVLSWLRTFADPLAAAMAAIALASFFWKLWSTKGGLESTYLSAPQHSEKLGLQATVGDDLCALLKGWVTGVPDSTSRSTDAETKRSRPSRSIWKRELFRWKLWEVQKGWFYSFVGIFFLCELIFLRSPATLVANAIQSVTLLLGWGFVAIAFKFSAPRPRRLLLVVDDLDRCHFDHLVSVMESLKLLLEDPEISRRVIVTMLIEEDILHHAIWAKYKHLAHKEATNTLKTVFDGSRIVRENCEKLFTAHLRLSPLDESEVEQIIAAFGGRERNALLSSPDSGMDVIQTPMRDDALVLGPGEKSAVKAALQKVRNGTILGPRAIRAFIFRYQLARLILNELGIQDWKPTDLATALAKRLFEDPKMASYPEYRAEIAAVVGQVA